MSIENIKNIKEFLKTSVEISEIEHVLKLKPEALVGVDVISGKNLSTNGINTIEDLASQSTDKLPEIRGLASQIFIKWIKIAKVVEKLVKQQIRGQKKILMIGLDNGGKSSILAVLQNKYSTIRNMLPTKGVKREKLDLWGYPIISWDLGGQVQYRENYYFNKPELFFTEVDLTLYVIDVQDPERILESANYFKQVLESLEKMDEHPPIMVVIHKSDQDIRRTLEWQKNVTAIKNAFDQVIEDFEMPEIEYCDTSIFQKTTITQMFSKALTIISDTSEIIEHILEDFTESFNGKGASLISMDGLIFGSYTKSPTDEKLIHNTALLLQTLHNFYDTIGLVKENTISLEFPSNKFTIRGEKLFTYSDLNIPVLLWTLSQKTDLVYERIEFFKEQLAPLINLFL